MILVTGATGTIGSEVVRLLTERGEPTRAMTRDPSKLSTYGVAGDFADPASLDRALDGADTVLALTAFGRSLADHDLALVEAAKRAGVKKIVKISAFGTGETTDEKDVRSWHHHGERAIRESGMAWTILRPAGFASNALMWAQSVRAGEPIPNMTGQGGQGIVDPRDVAQVAVEALTGSAHEGRTYELTGPEVISVPEQADQIGQALGRRVETVAVPLEAAKEGMLASGADPFFVEVAMTGFAFLAAGNAARLSGDVAAVLGRAPLSFADWVRDHRAAFE
ncbi:SDR family oxidoreductase [Nonomuraea sp. NPDC049152]|uniref:SDR family oxidoreductase n=1 Tax=Nonomuraea sp. NPDC049152 TaxID=3154350 RepID=UPI0033C6E2F5